MGAIATKQCSKCKTTKAVEEFHKDKGKHDGCCPHCKPCVLARNRAWSSANREARRQYQSQRALVARAA